LTQPTIDSEIAQLKAAGVDTLFSATISKFSSQAIRRVAEMGWKPLFLLSNVSTSVSAILEPAGLENAKGVVSSVFMKDTTDPQWKDDAEAKEFIAFMDEYYPGGNKADAIITSGYIAAQVMVQVLRQCGDEITRENVMKQAANLKNFSASMLLPNIVVNTSSTDFRPIEQMQLMKFNGKSWDRFGPIISGELSNQ
jgi:branched-chain amino acid transport system substrate-binding protein